MMRDVCMLAGHIQRVGAAVWHPEFGKGETSTDLVTCAADGFVRFWSMKSDEPVASLDDHGTRVARVAFHPSARYLAATW